MWRIESSAKKSYFHTIIIQYFAQIFNKNFDVVNNCCMAKFFDVFLSSIAIFFVSFCWGYYVLRDYKLALGVAIVIGLCSSYIVYRIVNKGQSKAVATKQKKAMLASFCNYLSFCENASDVFADLLKYYTFVIEKVGDECLVAVKNGQKSYVALMFDSDCVTVQEVRKAVKMAKANKVDKLVVFCLGAKATEIQLANGQLPTKFVDAKSCLTLFEQADKLPPLTKPAAKKSAYFCQFAFSKKRFGGYFASGMFLIVTSMLTFFPLYSIVWGTALLGVALYSLLNKRYNVVEKVATLE